MAARWLPERGGATLVAVHARARIVFGILAAVLLIFALSNETAHFARHEMRFLRMPIIGDAWFYFASGQAWLNGFSLYRDVFEPKPPLVFLLAALSIRLTSGPLLFISLQLILLGLLGPVLASFAFFRLSTSRSSLRWLAAATSLLLGLTFAVAIVHRTDGYQTEGFAVLFATLPTLSFASHRNLHRRFVLDLLASASLATATMLKEPFAASAVLAMLVFCQNRTDVLRLARVVVVAAILSIGILVASRSFPAYFSIYLPEVLTARAIETIVYPHYGLQLQFSVSTPLWLRTLDAYRIFGDLASPTTGTMLSLFILGCLSLWPALQSNDFRLRTVLAAGVLIGATVVSAHNAFVLHQLVSALKGLGQPISWSHPILVRLLAFTIVPALAVLFIVLLRRRLRIPRHVISRAGLIIAGLFTASSIAAFGGDFESRHLIFAFPPLLAVAAYCIVATAAKGRSTILILMLGALILNAAMPGRYDYLALDSRMTSLIPESERKQELAARVDALLTDCNIDRYLLPGVQLQALAAYTEHSPYQIFYGQIRAVGSPFRPSLHTANSYMSSKLIQDLAAAQVIIVDRTDQENTIPPLVAQVIEDDCTERIPACAASHAPIDGLHIFFCQH